MKKLQNKTYLLLISILTLFLLSLIVIFNVSIYNNEYKELKDKLIRVSNTHNKFNLERNEMKNPMFIDLEAYVISLDNNGNINNIISYTNEGLSQKQILKLIDKNINKFKIHKISNLYINKYIFWINNNNLIIINNKNVQKYLLSNLYISIIIFIILEAIILYVSILLTRWLVKPVKESFEKQKQFIYDASHELKTPLSIIMASAEAYEDNNKEKKWLENIKSESERMNKLVINLLDLSKSEDTCKKEIFSEINLSNTIKNKALSFESLMFEQNLTLKLNIEKNIMFKCNSEQIKELISILIDNAIKHGYEKSKIEIGLCKNKNTINLSVKNRGDAIKKEDQIKIFERFYRVDKSRNRDANRYGLGLAIAKNIVDNHNGNIYVECHQGYTTFIAQFKQN